MIPWELLLGFAVGWCAHWLGTYLAERQRAPYRWQCERCQCKITANHKDGLAIAARHHMREHDHV